MPVQQHPVAAVAGREPSLFIQLGGWPSVLFYLWAAGALGLFVALILQFARRRSAILATATQVDRAGRIRVVRTAAVAGPLAFGIVDRVIAVPDDFETRYSLHERKLALDHEIAHHRSGDIIANFVALVVLCLQWFNPVAWAAHAAFRFDQEAACDARVLENASGHGRVEYGRVIAKVASGRAMLFAGTLDRKGSLQRRLRCMLGNPSASKRLAGQFLVLATAAIAMPLSATRAVHYVDIASVERLRSQGPAETIPAAVSDSGRRFSLALALDQTRKTHSGRRRAVLERIQEAQQPQRQESLQREADQAQRHEEQVKREADEAQRGEEQLKRNADQKRRVEEQILKNAEQQERDRQQLQRNADEAKRNEEQRRREMEQSEQQQGPIPATPGTATR